MQFFNEDWAARRHQWAANRHEGLAICHRVLAGDETAQRAAGVVAAFSAHRKDSPDSLTIEDAAIIALRAGNGDMAMAHERARDDARHHLYVLGTARRAREQGLHLADYSVRYSDSGDSSELQMVLAYVDPMLAYQRGAQREVLRRALDAGLVGPATHCHHSYDCCGHWYQSAARVHYVARNLFAVTQGSHQNV